MATLTKGYTFQNGDVVTPTKLNNLVDSATVTNIVNEDISNTAAIALSKLATGALPTGITVASANIVDGTIATAKIANGAVTNAKLGNDIILVPAGAIMPFAMNSVPSGWLAANGDAVSRSTYATLFSAIGTTHGAGDGSTTFNLPDLRGYFIRGFGTNSDGTASAAFGAKQADEFKAHRHFVAAAATVNTVALTGANYPARTGTSGIASGYDYEIQGSGTDATLGLTSSTGSTETRPANIALLYCIKF